MVELDKLMENYEIAAPCPADWEEMDGDDRVRMCSLCQKQVYNISEIPPSEVVDLIHKNEGNLCVRMFKRADGTLINNNCPIGLRKVWDKTKALKAALVGGFLFLAGCVGEEKGDHFVPDMGSLAAPQPEQDTDPKV